MFNLKTITEHFRRTSFLIFVFTNRNSCFTHSHYLTWNSGISRQKLFFFLSFFARWQKSDNAYYKILWNLLVDPCGVSRTLDKYSNELGLLYFFIPHVRGLDFVCFFELWTATPCKHTQFTFNAKKTITFITNSFVITCVYNYVVIG